MKTLVTIMTIVLLMTAVANAGDPNDGLTLWGMSADGADHLFGARIGWVENQIEVGGSVSWLDPDMDWGPEPDFLGGYIVFHINETAKVQDPLPDNVFEQWLHAFIGRPFVGIEALMPVDGEQRTPKINWLVGTLISTSKDFKRSLVIEFATGQGIASDAEQILKIGTRIRF